MPPPLCTLLMQSHCGPADCTGNNQNWFFALETSETIASVVSFSYCIPIWSCHQALKTNLQQKQNHFPHPSSKSRTVLAKATAFVITGAITFWPKHVKMCLYNLQILTLFCPINFLRLQLKWGIQSIYRKSNRLIENLILLKRNKNARRHNQSQ